MFSRDRQTKIKLFQFFYITGYMNIELYILLTIKESYSRVNESKQQLNSFIIYDLDSIARVNERKKEEKKVKFTKM